MPSTDPWEDFTHSTRAGKLGATELLESYRAFKEFIGGLSKPDLVKRGWLTQAADLSPLAPVFFNLPLATQPTLFRKTAKANEALLSIWLARARGEAEIVWVTEEVPEFDHLTKEDLRKLAKLSVKPEVVRELPAILARFGVILVYIPALPGLGADGALFRFESGHPVIAMSLRFPRLDYFWFTLLHELSHLVLHLNRLKEPLFFDVKEEENGFLEKAANRLAKDSLVDPESWESCDPKFDPNEAAVRKYALDEGVHPALVAGLLRRESRNYTRYSKLINECDVRAILFPP